MIMNIFVGILCVLMAATGIFGFWMENIGLPARVSDKLEEKITKVEEHKEDQKAV